jgi:OOP family OmpA-OmpF porin
VRWLEHSLLALTLAMLSGAAIADDARTPQAPDPLAAVPAAPADSAAPVRSAASVDSAPPLTRRVVLRGVEFGSDTAYIEPESAGVLELVAEQLRENPELRVRIEGYTDAQAPRAYNLELSLERAESVKRILVGFGIAPNRLDAVGLGEADPVASNDTELGRTLNRRVELKVIE